MTPMFNGLKPYVRMAEACCAALVLCREFTARNGYLPAENMALVEYELDQLPPAVASWCRKESKLRWADAGRKR